MPIPNPQPALPEALGHLLEQQRFDDLERESLRLLDDRPDDVSAWSLLGIACHGQGRFERAADAFGAALRIDPEAADVHANLGLALQQLGDADAALRAYDRAIALNADLAPARVNRGVVLIRLGRLAEALENNLVLVERWPDVADFHFNCAEALLALGRSDDALAAASRAVELAPEHVKAHLDRALALSDLGRFADADQAFSRALALDAYALNRFAGLPAEGPPVRLDPRAIYLERTHQRMGRCDWTGRDDYLATFAAFILEAPDRPLDSGLRPLAYHALSLPVAPEVQLTAARRVAMGFAQTLAAPGPSPVARRAGQRIRLGYVSPDFRVHAVGLLMQDVFRLHARARFEVFAYSLVPDDGSDVRRKIAAGVGCYRDVTGLSDDAIARRIADDGIDILIDLAGYTDSSRSGVFARRPAGIQVNYLGYAGSVGAAYMDYAIADAVACPPGSDRYWTEKLVRLPTAFAPAGSDTPVGPIRPRRELGLPETGFVFCCFTSPYKIDPSIFGTWMRILSRVPGGCLWLTQSEPAVALNLRREAQARGIDPLRLVFATREPLPGYFARYHVADLFLDTRWFNAHTTVMDALRGGVPVLTVAGTTMAARLAASALRALDLPELIAGTLEELEESAVALALDPVRFGAVREKVKRNRLRAPLFDLARRVRELEAAYVEMFSRRQGGTAPESFAIPPQSVGLPLY